MTFGRCEFLQINIVFRPLFFPVAISRVERQVQKGKRWGWQCVCLGVPLGCGRCGSAVAAAGPPGSWWLPQGQRRFPAGAAPSVALFCGVILGVVPESSTLNLFLSHLWIIYNTYHSVTHSFLFKPAGVCFLFSAPKSFKF